MKKSHSQQQPKPNLDELAAKLHALTCPQGEEIPKGFEPIAFWADALQQDQSNVYALLNAGVKAGLLEEQRFRREGGKRRVKHWKEL